MIPAIDIGACTATAWQATPDLGLRALVSAGLLMLAGWASAQRFFPGQRAFVLLQLTMVGWIVATGAEQAAVAAGCKTTIALLVWPVILAQLPLWALFLHQYVHSETRSLARGLVALAAVPAVLLGAAALSNGWHGRFYGPGTHLGPPIAGLPRVVYDRGPLFVIAAAWGYAWLGAAALLVLRAWHRAEPGQGRHWAAFLLMMSVPWAANIAYLGFGLRLLGSDPTPLSYAVSVIGFAWLIRSDNLFKVVPLARRLLFAESPDPVLVLDTHQRVMDANDAATALAQQGGGTLPTGAAALAQWPFFGAALAALLDKPAAERGALQLQLADAVFEVRQREIGQGRHCIGRLLQLRDVTERQRTQARLVQTLAERNAQLAQVATLQAELREQALRDPLTGLHNRRALDELFAREAAARAATGRPLTLVLLDLDHFKRINDSGGHAAGDAVLCAVAAQMTQGLRAGDSVFRVGGEEFALLLPGAGVEAAAQRLGMLRQALHAAPLPGAPQGVSFSAGVAECGRDGGTLDTLLHAADQALYRAKAEGRDRVVVAGH